ncbi:hypothetical protein [Aquimarina sp. 2304DJ70-9]|uniref:hypothetical protein n=1 Tax=Aquimarina penaris TaxID=3231044 RepID=UPI003462D035
MVSKILKIKDIQQLSKNQKISINAGTSLPFPGEEDCGCAVMGSGGFLQIIAMPCAGTCPDGTSPIRGLHH